MAYPGEAGHRLMADIADVEQTLTTHVTSVIYPAGTTASSIIGSTVRIYRGWPLASNLNNDLAAGIINVTVVPDEAPGETTTRYLYRWCITSTTPGTSVSVVSNTIQIAGNPAIGDVVGALLNGSPYVYRIAAGDTTALVAANLGMLIGAEFSTTVQGSTIIVNQPATIVARVVSDGSGLREARRQQKNVRIIAWCPDPVSRDTLSAAIDQNIADISFLALPDTSQVRIIYFDTSVYDQSQNASLYRRDLVYTVEYPTIITQNLPSMLFGNAALNGASHYG